MAPVSAGDVEAVDNKYGVWISPIYNRSMQKHELGLSGYRSKAQGIVFGADSLINDDYLVGISYGQIYNKLTYRNFKTGDNTKGLTNIFSVYGSSNNINNPWFTEGILSYANTRLKNRSARLIYDGSQEVALGKYKSRAYSGQIIEGYNFQYGNSIILSPLVGLRYSHYRDASYKETGTSFQNLLIKGKKYDKFEGILGARTSVAKEYFGWTIIPELHAYLDYNFNKNKNIRMDAMLQGINAPIPTKQYKASRALYTIGSNVTIKRGKMEFGLGVDAILAKKYYAYQGTLKIKANI